MKHPDSVATMAEGDASHHGIGVPVDKAQQPRPETGSGFFTPPSCAGHGHPYGGPCGASQDAPVPYPGTPTHTVCHPRLASREAGFKPVDKEPIMADTTTPTQSTGTNTSPTPSASASALEKLYDQSETDATALVQMAAILQTVALATDSLRLLDAHHNAMTYFPDFKKHVDEAVKYPRGCMETDTSCIVVTLEHVADQIQKIGNDAAKRAMNVMQGRTA